MDVMDSIIINSQWYDEQKVLNFSANSLMQFQLRYKTIAFKYL